MTKGQALPVLLFVIQIVCQVNWDLSNSSVYWEFLTIHKILI